MLHVDAKSLKEAGDRLFEKKRVIDSRNQELADHFYPEVAEFTVTRNMGDEFADHLMSSYPVLVRRDLGNAIGSMLRPRAQEWFHIRTDRKEKEDGEAKAWLQHATAIQRRAMYDRKAMLSRATKEGDNAFATFGETCISVEVNRKENKLLYRNWHLRDVAWLEDEFGQIGQVHRNWKPSAADLCRYFPGRVDPKVERLKSKNPMAEVKCRHVMIRTDLYNEKSNHEWTSVWIDCDNNHLMQEVGSRTRKYVIPRWMTVPGSQYSYSPAAIIALPDARLIQAMTLTMLEAGEKAVNPPIVGVGEAIDGDLSLRAGGFTSIDREYDERLGEVLRPLALDRGALPFGLDMLDRQMGQLREAFFLNTLSMPPHDGPEMTAFEVGQRVQEYIRNALPLFEPMESEYNGELCDMTFETLLHEGAFGPLDQIPESIGGRDIQFDFESPLNEMLDRKKGQTFLEAKAMVAEAAEIEPSATATLNWNGALRDVLDGIGVKQDWLNSAEDVEADRQKQMQMQEAAMAMQGMQDAGEAAQKLMPVASEFGSTPV